MPDHGKEEYWKNKSGMSQPAPEDEVRVDALVSTYTIYNHLGYEAGTITTASDNPVAAYAVKVNAPYSRLKDAGYTYKKTVC